MRHRSTTTAYQKELPALDNQALEANLIQISTPCWPVAGCWPPPRAAPAA